MNPLKYFIFYLIFASQPSQSDIWVKDIKSPFFGFTSHLTSLGSNHISYGKHLLSLKREETKKFQLKDLILQAQEHYLSGEIQLALEVFEKITSLSHSADWDKEQRRMILYSFLRRSQSEKDIPKKQALLLLASQFTMSKFTKDHPDYNLFPPPLLQKLEEIQNQQTLLSLPLKKLFPHHEIILINGKRVSLKNKTIQVPESSYRITALSSSHTSWTRVVPISYLMTQSIKTNPLTLGYCKTLKVKSEWMKNNIKIFYNKDCENQKPLWKQKGYKESFSKTFDNKNYKEVLTKTSYKNKQKKFNFLKKDTSTWLIVGGALLTTGILLSLTIDNKTSSSSKIFY